MKGLKKSNADKQAIIIANYFQTFYNPLLSYAHWKEMQT